MVKYRSFDENDDISEQERETYLPPNSNSIDAAMKSGDKVRVFEIKKPLMPLITLFTGFEPTDKATKKSTGFILYPGANVCESFSFPYLESLVLFGCHLLLHVVRYFLISHRVLFDRSTISILSNG